MIRLIQRNDIFICKIAHQYMLTFLKHLKKKKKIKEREILDQNTIFLPSRIYKEFNLFILIWSVWWIEIYKKKNKKVKFQNKTEKKKFKLTFSDLHQYNLKDIYLKLGSQWHFQKA